MASENKIKFTEKEIQNYIWKQGKLSHLIIGDTPKIDVELTAEIEPDKIFQKIVFERLDETLSYTKSMDLIGVEVPLQKTNDSTIRADFLGVHSERVGISIIELKKSQQTERQAFTELLAYSNHLVSLFPTMSKEDVVFILISPMKERIVREAFLHALLFDNKRVIAFVPTFEDETQIDSLKLRLWIPEEDDISNFKNHYFSKNNFEVFKLTWSDIPYSQNPQKNPSDKEKLFMNSISSFVAQTMEEKNIHGFCFTSQCWPEDEMDLPNSLIIVGMNPYEIAFKNLFVNDVCNGELSNEDLSSLSYSSTLAKLDDIITGLKLEKDDPDDPDVPDYLEWLYYQWKENLVKIGFDSLNLLFKNTNGGIFSCSWNSFSWDEYISLDEHNSSFKYNVFPTGALKSLNSYLLSLDYDFIEKNNLEKHPIHDDIFHYLIESYYSHYVFNVFLERMLGFDKVVE
ncbi:MULTISPECIES: hypothetical protein [Bacillus]|uniref:hypothetical protein n=1 Tax=Bacillus TaxID=1386 RepID=UPI000BF723FA|nr:MULTISPECIES: hypothetical protein [Bacillus]MDA1612169.1 hypothetical protein [Bacillus cereus]PER69591.1 hypothetical protein CN502_09740 [Bacillus cereus]PFT09265.1 hypothetical protein COK59_09185 [Bacillus thuringiensis]PGL36022.1 hypothetical protein CN913_20465 [Bacillus cereus]